MLDSLLPFFHRDAQKTNLFMFRFVQAAKVFRFIHEFSLFFDFSDFSFCLFSSVF